MGRAESAVASASGINVSEANPIAMPTTLMSERTVNKHTRTGYFAQQQLELLRMDCSPLWHVQRQAPDTREQELRSHLGHFGFTDTGFAFQENRFGQAVG